MRLLVGGGEALAQPWAQPQHSPHPAVARIIAPEQNAMSLGSGTLVHVEGECGLVVTNWHVVRDATGEISVLFPDGFRSSARVAKVDRDWDLAALIVWRPNAQPVRLAGGAPRIGEPLTIAGYGSGDFLAQPGRCTQYVAPAVNLPFEMVEVSAQARQGDSGGPILNERGELAGVLFGAGFGTTSGSYAGRVKQFLIGVAPNLGHADVAHIADSGATGLPVQSQPSLADRSGNNASATPRTNTPRLADGSNTRSSGWQPSRQPDAPLFESPSPESASLSGPVAALTSPFEDVADECEEKEAATFVPPRITANRRQIESENDEDGVAQAIALEFDPEKSAAPYLEAAPSRSSSDLWQELAGASLIDHAKAFAAIFGVIAFAYHAARVAVARGEK